MMSLNPETLTFSAEGGIESITVTANNNWNVLLENSEDFFTVSPLSGTGDGLITVTTQANLSSVKRSAQIVIICASHDKAFTKTARIVQLGAMSD